MNSRIFALRLTGTIFGIVSILHLLRVVTGAEVLIAGWLLPLWVNELGFIATLFLSVWLWWLSGK